MTDYDDHLAKIRESVLNRKSENELNRPKSISEQHSDFQNLNVQRFEPLFRQIVQNVNIAYFIENSKPIEIKRNEISMPARDDAWCKEWYDQMFNRWEAKWRRAKRWNPYLTKNRMSGIQILDMRLDKSHSWPAGGVTNQYPAIWLLKVFFEDLDITVMECHWKKGLSRDGKIFITYRIQG